MDSSAKDTKDDVEELRAKLAGKADGVTVAAAIGRVDLVEDRVTRVESELKHLPNKDVTHHLDQSIGELQAEVRVLSERIKPIAAVADRLQEALLERVG
jgi:uncharacterized protein YPO0396